MTKLHFFLTSRQNSSRLDENETIHPIASDTFLAIIKLMLTNEVSGHNTDLRLLSVCCTLTPKKQSLQLLRCSDCFYFMTLRPS